MKKLKNDKWFPPEMITRRYPIPRSNPVVVHECHDGTSPIADQPITESVEVKYILADKYYAEVNKNNYLMEQIRSLEQELSEILRRYKLVGTLSDNYKDKY